MGFGEPVRVPERVLKMPGRRPRVATQGGQRLPHSEAKERVPSRRILSLSHCLSIENHVEVRDGHASQNLGNVEASRPWLHQ